MKAALKRRLLWVAATDSTFERMVATDGFVLSGRCIHCRKRLSLHPDGVPISNVTLEHIIPRTHGGTDAAANLALACARCNGAKGRRLDCRPLHDPDLQRVIERLRTRRSDRWRAPPSDWDLPEPPPDW